MLTNFDKKTAWIVFTIIVLLGAVVFVWYKVGQKKFLPAVFKQDIVVEEKLVIPETKKIEVNEGRAVSEGTFNAPLNPAQGEKVTSARAIFTLRQAYDKADTEAKIWAPDSALVSVKSLGVLMADGKSGEWQVMFGSKTKKQGYEVLVYGEEIVSKKEISSDTYGFDLPGNWYDSPDALSSLKTMPQFESATVSSISFYYNEDGKKWGYGIATSNGTVSMPVK